ncbi:MAG: cyclic nucleotide-binding domain-containing protein [Alphaproteobacteria bacterium]|nr:cyclic nucleotide-binding domain-containing protein [Alphaproteobacteria bacterium]
MVSKCWLFDRRSYQKGKKIFSQGELGETAYIVESGEVDIVKEIGGKQIYLATLGKGALFGEMAVIDGSLRMASAVASKPCVLMQLPRSVFVEKVEGTDPFIRALLGILIGNLRDVHKTYTEQPTDFKNILNVFAWQSDSMQNYINSVEKDEFSPDLSQRMEDVMKSINSFREYVGETIISGEAELTLEEVSV